MSIEIFDPHLHLFAASEGAYEWWQSFTQDDYLVIAKDFSVCDLQLSHPFKLTGFTHIEAGFDNQASWREIDYVEAHHNKLHLATIGCINLTEPPEKFTQDLAQLQARRSCRGVRHILDEKADAILNNPNTANNLANLASQNLIFELQMPLHNRNAVATLCAILQNLPSLRMVINHAGFIPKGTEAEERWQKGVQQLAQYPNVYMKCSGWEMTNRQYSSEKLRPIIEYIFQYFGEHRIMFASNFPLVLFSRSYQQYWCDMLDIAVQLTLCPLKVLSANARLFYSPEYAVKEQKNVIEK